jgi:hypothetical protein
MSLIGSFFLGLLGKIVFDWLKNSNGEEGTISKRLLCEQEFSTIKRDIKTMDGKMGRLDACLTQEKIKITALETLFAEHEKRLDQGRKDFREIKADASTINRNIAVLLDRAKSEQ